jgi:hypothetical protein
MGKWQLIETAPKDGSYFLGWKFGWGQALSCRWSDLNHCWYANGKKLDRHHLQPTHWIPLPKTPKGFWPNL